MRASIASMVVLFGACLSSPSPNGDLVDAGADLDSSGIEFLEAMVVPVDCSVITSETILTEGVAYQLVVSGVVVLAVGLEGDAEYLWNAVPPQDIRDEVTSVDVGLAIDDGVVDEERTPRWGTYRSDHTYEVDFIGAGAPINAQFHDTGCANNDGALDLAILAPPG